MNEVLFAKKLELSDLINDTFMSEASLTTGTLLVSFYSNFLPSIAATSKSSASGWMSESSEFRGYPNRGSSFGLSSSFIYLELGNKFL